MDNNIEEIQSCNITKLEELFILGKEMHKHIYNGKSKFSEIFSNIFLKSNTIICFNEEFHLIKQSITLEYIDILERYTIVNKDILNILGTNFYIKSTFTGDTSCLKSNGNIYIFNLSDYDKLESLNSELKSLNIKLGNTDKIKYKIYTTMKVKKTTVQNINTTTINTTNTNNTTTNSLLAQNNINSNNNNTTSEKKRSIFSEIISFFKKLLLK